MFEPSKSGFGFSKKFWFVQVESFSGGYFQNCVGLKIGSCFLFKRFRFKFAQVSKIGFKIFKSSFGKQAVSFSEVSFSGLRFTWQSQVSKIGYIFFRKYFDKFGSGF